MANTRLAAALAAWDRYQPDATHDQIIAQANAMAEAIRASLSDEPEPEQGIVTPPRRYDPLSRDYDDEILD